MIPIDDDLNILLNTWAAPLSPDSLEGRLRCAWRDQNRPHSRSWLGNVPRLAPVAGMFAGIAASAVVLLFVVAEAFPQSLAGHSGTASPFTVDSEVIEYKADGSSAVLELLTSTSVGALTLSSEFPGDPVRTAGQKLLDSWNLILWRVATPIRDRQTAYAKARVEALEAKNPALAKYIDDQQRTCILASPWTFVGNQTIQNYMTTAIQKVWMEEGKPVRFTQWSAPDLHCFALKTTTEKTFDGNYRLVFEQRALKVNMNSSAR